MGKKSKHILERIRNKKTFFISDLIKIGDFVICIDDEGDKSYRVLVPMTKKEKDFYGSFVNVLTGQKVIPRDYKWESTRKLKTLTFNKFYQVLDKRKEKIKSIHNSK